MYLDAVVSAVLGDDAEGMKRLEAMLAASTKESGMLYNAACACSLASRIVAKKDTGKAKAYADRAVALLKDAVAGGYVDYLHMLSDPDLDPLREHPGFVEILKVGRLDHRYATVWHSSATLTSTEVHGLDPSEHLVRCRVLVAQGYRPASLSATETRTGQRLTASVWHLPVLPEDEKETLAKRQANAAVALFKMGNPEKVWPLLKHSPDPRVRSWIIHKLGAMGADPGAIVKRLGDEPDLTIRRALALSLGEFGEQAIAAGERVPLMEKLRKLYRNDPDPGLHGAAEWLLRQWKQDGWLKQVEQELAKDKHQREQRLQAYRAGVGERKSEIAVVRHEPGPNDGGHSRPCGVSDGLTAHRITEVRWRAIAPTADRTHVCHCCKGGDGGAVQAFQSQVRARPDVSESEARLPHYWSYFGMRQRNTAIG